MRLIDTHSGMEIIDRDECLRLLAMHMYGVGRLAFVDGLHPVIVPVNYAMDEDRVVFRTAPGTKLDVATRGAPVCFEIDRLDPEHHSGWSVIVKGHADVVTSSRDRLRLGAHPLRVWAEGDRVNWVAIRPDVVTGRRINGLSTAY
jgi:nitroimidazol reductase NimA-like FMN-containing flavoprotein (pyridoxamine 5'-phosphate oxidase superfamily)